MRSAGIAAAMQGATASNLHYYWEEAKLLSLVMPSSGAAERVFSLLNNRFNQDRTHTLSDQIFLSLYLSYDKRS